MLIPLRPSSPPSRWVYIGPAPSHYPVGPVPISGFPEGSDPQSGAIQPLLPLTTALSNVSATADKGVQELAGQVKETGIGVAGALLGLAAAILLGAYLIRTAPPQIVLIEPGKR